MKYCSHCASILVVRIPPGETLPRYVCEQCQTIHYQNPKVVAGCIPEWEDHILLCRRAIEPRVGFWTFPAGFMELGESTEEAAVRETFEEARADVEVTDLYALFTLVRVNQVYVVFRGKMRTNQFGASHESSEVQLVPTDKIPWSELAFPVIQEILQRYAEDRKQGRFGVHYGVVTRGMR
jgi:ADP-ribose pyrophosphatase YjhB (NUDIX family)